MNFTISGAELDKNTAGAASINIKNNTTNTVEKSDFSSVLVSGIQINQKKLDENTYNSLLKETTDVKEQIMQSATDAKANLKALFNRLSGADMVQIDEDGFNLNDLSQEEMVGIVDRIKIELASHGKQVYFANGNVSAEEIEQVVGSSSFANEIADSLNENNLPATESTVTDMANALDKVGSLGNLSEDSKDFLIANNLPATVDNVYKAEHMQSDASSGKRVEVTEDEWQQLMPQAATVIEKAGLTADGRNLSNARSLLEHDIPITKENVLYHSQLDNLDVSDFTEGEARKNLVDSMAQMIEQGESAGDALLIGGENLYKTVADAINVVQNADIRHVAYVTEQGQTFSIENLRNAMSNIDIASYRFDYHIGENDVSEQNLDSESTFAESLSQTEVGTNYEKLQQIRILMTADAGLFLARQGVNLHAEPIANLVEQLEVYDELKTAQQADIYEEQADSVQTAAENVTAVAAQNTANIIVSSYQTVMQVKRALYEIEHAPDVSLGAVVKEKQEDEALTIADFANKGSDMRRQYEQAGESYNAVGTEVRKDLGDSLNKAVEASYEDILNEMNLENVQANKDAVRIFAENQMEITREGIDNIKEINATLQNIIKNMKPEVTLKMIRENINPMTEDIHAVNDYIMQLNEELTDSKEEKYSQFLYKLDRTDGITSQEREQFIGIYKMMNIFTKDAGAAIGTLVKQNEDITMANLCKAYQSRKAAGIDMTLDDSSPLPAVTEKVNYFNNLFESTQESITPLTLRTANRQKEIPLYSVEEFCEEVDSAYDEQEEIKYYDSYLNELRNRTSVPDEIVRELTDNEQPVTMNQVIAMENIMQSGYFDKVFKNSSDSENMPKPEEFIEKMDNREDFEALYDNLETAAGQGLENALNSDENQNYESINELRMRNKEIGLIKNLSLRHDYKVPFVTESGVGLIHFTLINDSEQKGRISISLNDAQLGNVSVEARVSDTSAELYGISERASSELNGRLENAAESLKEVCGVEDTQVNCQNISTVRRVTYDKAADSVSTNELYRAAKTIISSIVA
jgi:hypothetical protein